MAFLKTTLILICLLMVSLSSFAQSDKILSDSESSVYFDSLLDQALEIARENLHTQSFTTGFESNLRLHENDEPVNIDVTISVGYLFSNRNRHVLITRTQQQEVRHISIFHVNNHRLQAVVNLKSRISAIEPSFKDINGDQHKDFLVHEYSSGGCCRRNVYYVFINKNDDGGFHEQKQFMNPTFSPKEKIVRGVEYGHPGNIGLYKYKWVDFEAVAVEYIYPNNEDKSQRSFIKTKHTLSSNSNAEQEELSEVPKEYLDINDYDWFSRY